MKLWLLKAREIDRKSSDPWVNAYDCYYGFVIRAETEERARQLASKKPGDEGEQAWLNPSFSSCDELTADGDEEIVVSDFNAG